MPILDGLDDFDWPSLEHAYGSAAGVPELLARLLDPDPAVRNEGWGELYSSVLHQGSFYPATAPTARVLIRLAPQPDVPDRHAVLNFLRAAATPDFVEELARAGRRWPYLPDEDAPDRGGEGEYLRASIIPAVLAVREGVPTFLPLLDDPGSAARRSAARLIEEVHAPMTGGVPSTEATARLLGRLDREDDADVRVALLFALRTTATPDVLAYLVDHVLLGDADETSRWAAAVVVTHFAGTASPAEAADLLRRALAEGGRTAPEATSERHVGVTVEALARVDPDACRSALVAGLAACDNGRLGRLARHAVALAYPAGRPGRPPAGPPTPAQREVLAALLERAGGWGKGHVGYTLRAHGLPDTPREVRRLLADA